MESILHDGVSLTKDGKQNFVKHTYEFFYFSSFFMTTQKYNKPVIVLDVGKVLVDYDPTVVAKGLSKRCGREVGLPQADDLYRLFFPVYVGTQSWRDVLQTINSKFGSLTWVSGLVQSLVSYLYR